MKKQGTARVNNFADLAAALGPFGASAASVAEWRPTKDKVKVVHMPAKQRAAQTQLQSATAELSTVLHGFEKAVMMNDVEIGIVGISVKGYATGGVRHIGNRTSWFEVYGIKADTPRLEVAYYLKVREGISASRHTPEGENVDVVAHQTITLDIPITWRQSAPKKSDQPEKKSDEPKKKVPNIVKSGKDFSMVFFTDKRGKFRLVKIFVASRFGRFYVGVNILVGAQLTAVLGSGRNKEYNPAVCEITVNNVNFNVTCSPATTADAYTGFKPFVSFHEEMKPFARRMIGEGKFEPVHDIEVPTWRFPTGAQLPEYLVRDGFELVAVMYWDVHRGMGKALAEDGVSVYVHFSSATRFPVGALLCLRPGEHIAIKRVESNNGPQAEDVRLLS